MHVESDLHIAAPESEAFLAADLRGELSEKLEETETVRRQQQEEPD